MGLLKLICKVIIAFVIVVIIFAGIAAIPILIGVSLVLSVIAIVGVVAFAIASEVWDSLTVKRK